MATAPETRDYFTKLYLAAFLRAPEIDGLNYWSNEVLVGGKSLQAEGGVIFSLPIVTAIYPVFLTPTEFVEQIYENVFGRASDAGGSAYWSNELVTLQNQFAAQGSTNSLYEARAQLTLNMINAGIGAVGADGHEYIMNRMEVAEFAIDEQYIGGMSYTPEFLLAVMAGVDATQSSVDFALDQLASHALQDFAMVVSDPEIIEGNAGVSQLAFKLILDHAPTDTVTFNVSTSNVTATAGVDYEAVATTVTFVAGQTVAFVNVNVVGDVAPESSETMQLNVTGDRLVNSVVATGTITNDDVLPQTFSLTMSAPAVTEGNAGTTQLAFQLTLDAAPLVPVTINVATVGGTATAGQDYIALAQTVTFAVGQTTAFVNVDVIGDVAFETSESVILQATGDALVVSPVTSTGTITNDDIDTINTPQTVVLTPGIDDVRVDAPQPDMRTSNADDTIVAGSTGLGGTSNTLNAGDMINGGLGIDTLRIATSPLLGAIAGFESESVERFQITSDSFVGLPTIIDMSGAEGVTDVINKNSVSDIEVLALNAMVDLTIDNLTDLGGGYPETDIQFQDSVLGGATDQLDINVISTPNVFVNVEDVSGGNLTNLETINLNIQDAFTPQTEVRFNAEVRDGIHTLIITDDADNTSFIDVWNTFSNATLIDASTTHAGVELEADTSTVVGTVTMHGGAGNDDLYVVGSGDSSILAHDGNDKVEVVSVSGTSTIQIDLGAGNDTLDADSISNNSPITVEGGAGNDQSTITGTTGSDVTTTDSSGQDTVIASITDGNITGTDTLGDDQYTAIIANNGTINLTDLAGNNTLSATAGNNGNATIAAGAGDDVITVKVGAGGNGNATIATGDGANTVSLSMGATGNASVTGGARNDAVTLLTGAAAAVFNVQLGAGFDYLNAVGATLSGDDTLNGGSDTLGSIDTIDDQQAGLEAANISAFEHVRVVDQLTGASFDAAHFTGAQKFVLLSGHGAPSATIQSLAIGQSVDVWNENDAGDELILDDAAFITQNTTGIGTLPAIGGDNFKLGQYYSADLIVNFSSNEIEHLEVKALNPVGFTSRLEIRDTGLRTLTLDADDAGNTYVVSTGSTHLFMVDGSASTSGLDLQKVNYEGATLGVVGSATQALTLTTGSGNDTVFGGMNNDTIVTNAGDDILWGAQGFDSLTGGAGADDFFYRALNESGNLDNAGRGDVITDFTSFNVNPLIHDQLNMSFLLLEQFGNTPDGLNGNRANFGLAQGALMGGGHVSAVFQQDEHLLWVDLNGDGTLDGNDLRITMNGVTSLAQEDFTYGFVFTAPGSSITGTLFDDAFFSTEANFVGSTAVGGLGDDTVFIHTDVVGTALNIAAPQLNSIEHLVLQGGFSLGGATTVAGAGLEIVLEDASAVVMNDVNQTVKGSAGADTINGSSSADSIVGGAGDNDIEGEAGNDTITAEGGNDTIDGEGGNDSIDAGGGANLVTGGSGEDTITTGSGNDTISGGSDADTIDAGDGDNFVEGGTGADSITTGTGGDTINGEDGADTINAGEGANFVSGGIGADSITTGADADTIGGGDDNDTIDAGDGANRVFGDAGNDSITTGSGDDTIEGGNDADTIESGTGADSILGDTGNDLVMWDAADVYTNGGTGVDTLVGTSADDLIVEDQVTILNYNHIMGMEGNDTITLNSLFIVPVTLEGGEGNDVLSEEVVNNQMAMMGGVGDDTVNMFAMTVADTVNGGDDYDVLNFTDSNGLADDVNNVTNIERINLGDAVTAITTVDTLVAAGATLEVNGAAIINLNSLTFNGAAESDGHFSITSTSGADSITGGALSDVINAGDNTNTVHGGAGDDTITTGALGNQRLFGEDGDDLIIAGTNFLGSHSIEGGNGNDTIISSGNFGTETLLGGDGNDRITIGTANSAVKAGAGDDLIIGGVNVTGADVIQGLAGEDTLTMTDNNGAANDLDGVTTIENITFGDAATIITTLNSLVFVDQDLVVDASALTAGHALNWNGGAESNGYFNVIGGAGNDLIVTGTTAPGAFVGDTVKSGAGNDSVLTLDGNDKLDGGAGVDILIGGAGEDLFSFDSGDSGTTQATADRIGGSGVDFVALVDSIQFENGVAATGSNYGEVALPAAVDYNAALASANLSFGLNAGLSYVVVEVNDFTGGAAADSVLFFRESGPAATSSVILTDVQLTGISELDIVAYTAF